MVLSGRFLYIRHAENGKKTRWIVSIGNVKVLLLPKPII